MHVKESLPMSQNLLTFTNKWRFIDHSTLGPAFDALQSFAYDDTICKTAGEDGMSTLRSWVHHQTVVLGTQDSRLPHIEDGITYLKEQGYHVIVRNSGGLAVVLDEGVLNLSLIMKEDKKISIDAGYEMMFELIKDVFKPYGKEIEAYEIVGSYCPGSFDLSIGGKKFAGISQRRIRGGVAVQIYLCITGSGAKRAEMIREFYRHAVQGSSAKFDYPKIEPETMASLSELLNTSLTVSEVMMKTLQSMQRMGAVLSMDGFTGEEMDLYEKNMVRVTQRNNRCLHIE
ncbi:lipoate--protein ligase family protein [Alkalihalophilus marmarensis]|uniref:lipoate--protein ligase family protein n=1 Tax=Alkalihalophilus marmarensis TaxID=521377 RepID=UPI002E23064C|nr:lipoate--protein ligase family protein [Alkalihalophilus marmarensis]